MAASAECLTKKKNSTSVVWEHFRIKSFTANDGVKHDNNKPVCLHCHKHVAAKGGNTTNLFTHLRDKHPSIYATITLPSAKSSGKEKQPTIGQSISMSTKYLPSSGPAIALDKAVAYCIAIRHHPFTDS